MDEKMMVHMYDDKPHRVIKRGDHIYVEKTEVPDTDTLILTDEEGYRYRRVIVPENYFLFKKI